MKIGEIIFDEWNIKHMARHRIKPEEIGEMFKRKVIKFPAKKGRKMIVGETNSGRIVSIVLDRKSGNKYYLVTARDSSKKERLFYKENI